MKIVIAKTYEQFVRCCHQRNLSVQLTPHIQSVAQVEKIKGAVEPIFFGDFWNIKGYAEIEKAMKAKGIKVKDNRYVKRVEQNWGDASE